MYRNPGPQPLNIPKGCEEVEVDYQRQMFVEDRLSQISTLKHDRLNLRERFLQTLIPPPVLAGFSEEISRLSIDNRNLLDRVQQLTVDRDRLLSEQIKIVYERYDDVDHMTEKVNWSAQPQYPIDMHRAVKVVIVCILIAFFLGCTVGLHYSPWSVESDPVGTVHSERRDSNGTSVYQPQQGPSPSSQGNRRVQKNLPFLSP